MLTRLIAAVGVLCIEQAIYEVIRRSPNGLNNATIAKELNIRFGRQYVTWEILKRMVRRGDLSYDDETKLYQLVRHGNM